MSRKLILNDAQFAHDLNESLSCIHVLDRFSYANSVVQSPPFDRYSNYGETRYYYYTI